MSELEHGWALVAVGVDDASLVVDCNKRFALEVEHVSPFPGDIFPLEDAPPKMPGLYVWEGDLGYSCDGEEVNFYGDWRRATAAEVIAFVQGRHVQPKESANV